MTFNLNHVLTILFGLIRLTSNHTFGRQPSTTTMFSKPRVGLRDMTMEQGCPSWAVSTPIIISYLMIGQFPLILSSNWLKINHGVNIAWDVRPNPLCLCLIRLPSRKPASLGYNHWPKPCHLSTSRSSYSHIQGHSLGLIRLNIQIKASLGYNHWRYHYFINHARKIHKIRIV